MRYTNDEIKTIIDLYSNGHNTVQIASDLNKSQTGIERLLKRNNLYAKKSFLKITDINSIKDIIDMYVNKRISTTDIGLKYNVSDNTIASILRKNNVIVTRKRCRTIIHSDYFKNIDTEFKAYFLGFIIADGSIILDSKNKKSFAFSIVEQDSYILTKLSQEISNGILPIQIVKYEYRQNMSSIRFSDQEFILNLEQYGVIPNKTYNTFFPDIPSNMLRHFIRGYFDGDGCVCLTSKRTAVSFVGSKILIPEIFKILFEKDIIQRIPTITDRGNFCSSSFAKKQSVINFYHYIYDNSNIYLTRKKDKFTGVLNSNI